MLGMSERGGAMRLARIGAGLRIALAFLPALAGVALLGIGLLFLALADWILGQRGWSRWS